MQTLTELSLDKNDIGYKGAQSIGEGLQKSTVTENFIDSCRMNPYLLFHRH